MRLIIDNARVKHRNGQPAGPLQGLTKEQTEKLAAAAIFAAFLESFIK